jgi:hypothetical protein
MNPFLQIIVMSCKCDCMTSCGDWRRQHYVWHNILGPIHTIRHVSIPFRHGTSPFSKIFLCVINPLNAELNPICHLLTLLGAHPIFHISRIRVKRRCTHWKERLRHVSFPFRLRCRARMIDVTERVQTSLYLLDSDNVNSLMSSPLHFECLLAKSSACFCLQKWLKN